MQTLVFNTTEKTVKIYEGVAENSTINYSFSNIPTVRADSDYYEVMQKNEALNKSIPVFRAPIQSTNMMIDM